MISQSTVNHVAGAGSDGEGDEGAKQGDDEDKRVIFWVLELNSLVVAMEPIAIKSRLFGRT